MKSPIIVTVLTLMTASAAFAADIEAGPENADAAIVLVHDWFGVTPFYEETVDRLAAHGYRVLAVDLYDGEAGQTHAEAWALMSALDADAARAEVDAAIHDAAQGSRNVVVMGFSMGADYAFPAARDAGADALVIFYGSTPADSEALARLEGPTLAIYGSLDGNAAEQAMAFSQAADAVEARAEIHIFPGRHHAFAQPLFNAGGTYDPVAAEAAWGITLDFLERALAD